MSTSYGPGRYDAVVRSRGARLSVRARAVDAQSQHAGLSRARRRAAASTSKRSSIGWCRLTRRRRSMTELAKAEGVLPLGVVIQYPDEQRAGRRADPDHASRPSSRRRRAHQLRAGRRRRVRHRRCSCRRCASGRIAIFLRGVVSRTGTQGSNFARDNQVEVLSSDLDAVLKDPEFQLVVIATRHHEHADQVVRVAERRQARLRREAAGDLLGRARTGGEHVRGTRRAAAVDGGVQPTLLAGAAGAEGAARRPPLAADDPVPAERRLPPARPLGARPAGRRPQRRRGLPHVRRLPVPGRRAGAVDRRRRDRSGHLPYARSDNFAATITYGDGSVASLVYTALGPKSGLGKEHITVFCDGEAFIVDDFKKLTKASDGSVLWQSGEPDKGHFEELSRLGDALATGGAAPIPFEEIVETSAVALSDRGPDSWTCCQQPLTHRQRRPATCTSARGWMWSASSPMTAVDDDRASPDRAGHRRAHRYRQRRRRDRAAPGHRGRDHRPDVGVARPRAGWKSCRRRWLGVFACGCIGRTSRRSRVSTRNGCTACSGIGRR